MTTPPPDTVRPHPSGNLVDIGDAPVLLFDGRCGLCSAAVRFVLARERRPEFRFAPLQSDIARALLAERGHEVSLDTVVVIEHSRVLTRSRAVLAIARRLRRPWSWAVALRAVPTPLADAVYMFIARHRHRVLGRTEACMVARGSDASRFLGE